MTLVLLTKALPWLERLGSPHVGRLLTPRHVSRVPDTYAAGIPWAADNDAYLAWDEDRYLALLRLVAGVPGGRFVVAPDVVADAERTLALWSDWLPTIRPTGQPVALVAQDGLTPADVPWPDLGALFVGGSTVWKMGADAVRLIGEARARGIWTHVGRVNSARRLRWARSLGVDSVDGSGAARFPDKTLRVMLAEMDGPAQLALPSGAT